MTRDELMALARQAGYIPDRFTSASTLERFAALVRADEREACAKVLDRNVEACINNSAIALVLEGNAMAIRARKDKQ